MKKLTPSQWEEKYIRGPVEQFDEKNTMFRRPYHDPEIRNLLEDWSFGGKTSQKPGYTMWDQALRYGSRRGTALTMLDTSKPNPGQLNMDIAALIKNPSGRVRPDANRPVQRETVDVSDPAKLSRYLKKASLFLGADLVGICQLDRRFVYSHTHLDGNDGFIHLPQEIPEEYQYAIVTGFGEDYHLMKYYPTYIADAATSVGYARMAISSANLSLFIRMLGFQAIDCSINAVVLSTPLAILAGFGDIGRNGLLITPEFGPRLRVTVVLTDMPLVADSPIDFGVIEFCTTCKKCVSSCPSRSIMEGERTTEPNNISNLRNTLKWPLNAETCRAYWGRVSKPCTACIASCPYNKEINWFHSTARWFTDHARWADPLYVKLDDLCGYGKPKAADSFWEEWNPINAF